MMALNFQAPKHARMLKERTKDCTVRLGDRSRLYPEGSIVWVTTGPKFQPKEKLYAAFIDKVRVKTMAQLTSEDLEHQNPEISTREALIEDFEQLYKKRITMDDTVTVIYFTEIKE
ncbi:MAG: RNA-binding protein [Schwartzia sp.]|nr:RNA-binding protein [Schwartzia sp. (in: firmicutes)]